MSKRQKLQPFGQLTQELENVISKMIIQHGLQIGEIDAIVHGYMEIHFAAAKEPFIDGTQPVKYYGHIDGLIAYARSLKRARVR